MFQNWEILENVFKKSNLTLCISVIPHIAQLLAIFDKKSGPGED